MVSYQACEFLFSRSGFTKPLVQQAMQEDVLLFNGPAFQRIS